MVHVQLVVHGLCESGSTSSVCVVVVILYSLSLPDNYSNIILIDSVIDDLLVLAGQCLCCYILVLLILLGIW